MHLTFQRFLAICGLAILWQPFSAYSQVYGGTNPEGTIVLSNFKSREAPIAIVVEPGPGQKTGMKTGSVPAAAPYASDAFKAMLEDAGRENNIDPALLHAVILVESNYNSRAVSGKGAGGLMQLMPDTARRFGVTDVFNPRENVLAGARYLSWLLNLFKGDLELALAAYNSGEQSVIRAGYRVPAFAETRNYVPKVLRHYRAGSPN